MHAISSYRGNRPTHSQTGPITIHCAVASAQCNRRSMGDCVNAIPQSTLYAIRLELEEEIQLHGVTVIAVVGLLPFLLIFSATIGNTSHHRGKTCWCSKCMIRSKSTAKQRSKTCREQNVNKQITAVEASRVTADQ